MNKDRLEECFSKIQESITTMNHNSTTTSKAMDRIADAIDKMELVLTSNATKIDGVDGKVDKQIKTMLSIIMWTVIALIITLAAVLGVNLKIPFMS